MDTTKAVPQEVGDVRVPYDPDFHVLVRIRKFREMWPDDPSSRVRTDPRVGFGKQLFRYAHRLYHNGSRRRPEGVMVPGMVSLLMDGNGKPEDGEFVACISDAQNVELRDHLDGQRTISFDEYLADRSAKNLRVGELMKYGERITTASGEEKLGRALSQFSDDPDMQRAVLDAWQKKHAPKRGPGRPRKEEAPS